MKDPFKYADLELKKLKEELKNRMNGYEKILPRIECISLAFDRVNDRLVGLEKKLGIKHEK